MEQRYTLSKFEKMESCLLYIGKPGYKHLEEVPGWWFEITDTETGEKTELWATRYCGLWNITSPYYGRAILSQNYKTRKAAIEALISVGAKKYFHFLASRRGLLAADRDELANEYYGLVRDWEQSKGR